MARSLGSLANDIVIWNVRANHLDGSTTDKGRRLDNPVYADEEVQDLTIRIIEEEVEELKEALRNKDEVEVLDAVADIIYTAIGAASKAGLSRYVEAALEEVIRSNDSKLKGNSGSSKVKVGKGKYYQPPNLTYIMEKVDRGD